VLLERALALEPLDAQAWLTRATLLELRGDYPGARRACARLVRSADEFSALTCLTSVASRNGQLTESFRALSSTTELDSRLAATLRAWRLVVVADMAERLGEDGEAEATLRAALQAARDDPYLKAAYADLLLRTGRPREVLALLAGNEAQDALLLRLAIAGRRLAAPEATRWVHTYEERRRAAERDGDSAHQREQALYLLEVRADVPAALEYARRNWAVQREPADLRIYARAAASAHSAADCAQLAHWIEQMHYEDRLLPGPQGCGAPWGPS
jgi:Tetratricopeptide repeat